MAILEARAVHKTYRTRGVETKALAGVDLLIEEGEFSALAGPSGSGKTTLLNVLGALDEPTSGKITLDGQHLSDLSPAQLADLRLHKLGFVFQAYNLIHDASIEHANETLGVVHDPLIMRGDDEGRVVMLIQLGKEFHQLI